MIDEIVHSHSLVINDLRRLIDDVPDEKMTMQVDTVVNHPAWVIGHLTYSFEAIGGELGITPWLPKVWAGKFGTGSTPVAERESYPSKVDLLKLLADAQQRVVSRLNAIGEPGLSQPLPDIRYREIFPTVGQAVVHVLTAHAALHVGQLTVWRRAVGLPPLIEPIH
ncbi:MAG: DinB family protein [Pirellulales bacterium]